MSQSNSSAPVIEDYLNLSEPALTGSIKILCKFVVLKHRDRLHFIWGPVAEYPYHANLVERFCQSRAIPCSWASKPTLLELFDSETTVRGGGYAEIRTEPKQIIFGGRSTAYGRFIGTDLDEILTNNHLVDGYSYSVHAT